MTTGILGAILGWIVGGMLLDRDYWRAFVISAVWLTSVVLFSVAK